jgi:SAM-dependent methyltransferase
LEYFEFSREGTYALGESSLRAEVFEGKPVPVESRVRLGYGGTAQDYLASGVRDVSTMLRIIAKCGWPLPAAPCVLDFGCGGGRMLRHMPTELPGGTYWGCDTESRAIAWAQVHLGAPFRLFTNLREPHLPFRDGEVDFVFAGSVFSHLHDLAECWLLELRRITRERSGLLYLTFQDESSLAFIRGQSTPGARHYFNNLFGDGAALALFDTDYKRVVIGRDRYSSQVFYRTAWLESLLGQFFSEVQLVPHGYGWQTAAVLRP